MANPTGQQPTPTAGATPATTDPHTPTNMLLEAFKGDTLSASLAGWGILFVVLMFLASFDSTASIAAAMSWLILAAVLLFNGDKALKNILG